MWTRFHRSRDQVKVLPQSLLKSQLELECHLNVRCENSCFSVLVFLPCAETGGGSLLGTANPKFFLHAKYDFRGTF